MLALTLGADGKFMGPTIGGWATAGGVGRPVFRWTTNALFDGR